MAGPFGETIGATAQDPRAFVTVRARRVRLRVVSGPEAGRALEVPPDGVLIGSQPPADLSLSDANVSRRHAEIRRAANGYVLTDLGSTNGTYLGDVRIQSVYLGDAATFRVGQTKIAFEAMEEEVRLEPAPPREVPGLVAEAAPTRELVAALHRFGPTDLSVVLEGETGVGKEVAARAIHRLSRRSGRPLVVVDCGALQENLVESDLFGHERGAFTGAVDARAGAFETADGGTIFLDEVGELPLPLQPKLLRALEAREVRRLGSNRVRTVDVRVLAASNRDLPTEVTEGRFRADLFFRLSEVRLRVPPLRERLDDVAPLATAIADEVDPSATFRPEALDALRARSWPGNVRELANTVKRAVVAAEGAPIGPEHLAPADFTGAKDPAGPTIPVDLGLPLLEAREAAMAEFNRVYLEGLVARHAGDLQKVARHAGVHPKSLQRLFRKTRKPAREEESE